MSEPVICPICQKTRPYFEEYSRGEVPERSKVIAALEGYDPCCNPLCKGEWGTNCWHCHLPLFLENLQDSDLFRCAYMNRDARGPYWHRLLLLSSDRIQCAFVECSDDMPSTDGQLRYIPEKARDIGRRGMALLRKEAIAAREVLLAAEPMKVRAKAILECKLAVCKYCRASAESGETTVHTCVAAPLTEMYIEVIEQIGKAEK